MVPTGKEFLKNRICRYEEKKRSESFECQLRTREGNWSEEGCDVNKVALAGLLSVI